MIDPADTDLDRETIRWADAYVTRWRRATALRSNTATIFDKGDNPVGHYNAILDFADTSEEARRGVLAAAYDHLESQERGHLWPPWDEFFQDIAGSDYEQQYMRGWETSREEAHEYMLEFLEDEVLEE